MPRTRTVRGTLPEIVKPAMRMSPSVPIWARAETLVRRLRLGLLPESAS